MWPLAVEVCDFVYMHACACIICMHVCACMHVCNDLDATAFVSLDSN